jgi:hypothetical protein
LPYYPFTIYLIADFNLLKSVFLKLNEMKSRAFQ